MCLFLVILVTSPIHRSFLSIGISCPVCFQCRAKIESADRCNIQPQE